MPGLIVDLFGFDFVEQLLESLPLSPSEEQGDSSRVQRLDVVGTLTEVDGLVYQGILISPTRFFIWYIYYGTLADHAFYEAQIVLCFGDVINNKERQLEPNAFICQMCLMKAEPFEKALLISF